MKYHCIHLLNIYWLFKYYILGMYIFHVIGTWNKLSVCVCVCVCALTNECKDRQAISTQHRANRDDHFNQSVHLELSRTVIRHSTLTLASTKFFTFFLHRQYFLINVLQTPSQNWPLRKPNLEQLVTWVYTTRFFKEGGKYVFCSILTFT